MFFCMNCGGKTTHHIRTIKVVSNLTETLCLTLRTEHTGGFIQAFQCSIILRLNAYRGAQLKLVFCWLDLQVTVRQCVLYRG